MSPKPFPQAIPIFRDRRLPMDGKLCGYAALIDAYDLSVPLPTKLSAIGLRHKTLDTLEWRIFTPRHEPQSGLEGHLTFALKYEGVDLGVLKCLFELIDAKEIAEIVRLTPTGAYVRRLWFLFEWLTNKRLDIPDIDRGNYVDVVDTTLQYASAGLNAPRQRVRNNLPGTPAFCPMIFRTPALERYTQMALGDRARAIAAKVPADLLSRTAAFLLLKDSRASYVIEGEVPPHDRMQRWGRAIGEAGLRRLDLPELLRLQKLVIGDARFVRLGLRDEGGFVGQHIRDTGAPLPDHISARHQDLSSLMEGLLDFDQNFSKQLDPVIAATILAFGFVYIHPFEDGNGRLHRYLIHHALAEGGFNPPGVVFPVSSAILERIEEYRVVLETRSRLVLPLIEWRPTPKGNVEVTNPTSDLYRYFDATAHAEFLYACVEQTVETDLPREADYLRRYDQFRSSLSLLLDMPDRSVDLLVRMLTQNQGKLSKRALAKEFAELHTDEVAKIEEIFAELFGDIGTPIPA